MNGGAAGGGVAARSAAVFSSSPRFGAGASSSSAAPIGIGGAKVIDDELSLPILLAERVRKAALEADTQKSDCADLAKQVDLLADMLRSAARFADVSPTPFYDRPIRRIFAAASQILERALAFARRCRRASVLRRVVTITTGATDHRKIQALLDASLGDLRWLLSLYSDDSSGGGIGIVPSLPPIASTDPILAWVWGYIATVQMGASATDRDEAATALANLALDSDRNKNFIIDEGGLQPLLSLLGDGPSVEARIAAALALSNLASTPKNVTLMLKELAVPVIVGVLYDAPMRLQTRVASLVSRMAAEDYTAQEEFAKENACRPLVLLLSFEVSFDDPKPAASATAAPRSIHSLVRGMASGSPHSTGSGSPHSTGSGSSGRGGWYWERSHRRKHEENETPEAKLQLKLACSQALWMLTRGRNVSNSRNITETKGLLCLAKIIEREKGELQYNCLMTIMEIAAAAESDADLRCSAFKINSPVAKPVVDQLLRLVQLGSSPSSALEIAAVKAIGSLARTFSAKEMHVLSPLVVHLGHWNPDVVIEAANALGKFACPDNFLCAEHSKAIIEFGAVPQLLRLLRTGEKTQLPALTLLCHLTLHAPNSEALGRYKVLGTLESVARTAIAHHPDLRELLPDAMYHLELYRGGGNSRNHQVYAHTSLPI